MRILVTGSRTWRDSYEIACALWEAGLGQADVTVVHGGANGADAMAGEFAKNMGWKVEVHRADWAHYRKAAGPARNQIMVNAGADVCLAFPTECRRPECSLLGFHWSHGTQDCADRARRAGIPVKVYWQHGEGGDSEPAGSRPDSPATPEARVLCPTG